MSITSSRPQTTRNVIRGVVNGPDPNDPTYQIVFLDTPGLHKPKTDLGDRLNALVYGTLGEADVVMFMIDASMPVGPGDRLIAERLQTAGSEVIVAVNKIDGAGRGEVVKQLAKAGEWDFASYVPVSAIEGAGLDALVGEIVERLPEGPRYYPPGMTTDQPESLVIGEMVREKFLERLNDELPHSLLVRVQELEQRADGLIDISAHVIVERKSQKGIVIGKGGSLLKIAGTEARQDLEILLGNRVNLSLHVTVEKDWQRSPQLLDRFGFTTV